ncbi:MAG: alpha/beta fold hydrolase [Phycicoccus sp.]
MTIHYAEHGSGAPLVALHGAGVDHREIEAAVESLDPGPGLRRIYPDLPGMGRSTAGSLTCNDDVVDLLIRFVHDLGEGPALVVGHSYGAYLARGIAARRPDLVRGLALWCPVSEMARAVPGQAVVHEEDAADDELGPGQRVGFEEYVVVRTAQTARRYRDHVAPGTELVDEEALSRIFVGWRIDLGPQTFGAPTLILAARHDSVAGYQDAVDMLGHYPRATLAVVEDAGHALPHERPEVVAALFSDWLRRAGIGGA